MSAKQCGWDIALPMPCYCSHCAPPVFVSPQQPFACPVCHGHKTVSKPPHIAGDVSGWFSSGVETYPCPTCDGTGIIWGPR